MKRLALLSLAALLLVAGVAAGSHGIDLNQAVADKPYQIWPSRARSSSPSYVKATIEQRNAQGDNCKVVMGTSEFRMLYPEPCSSHPGVFFADNNYGMDTYLLGSHYCQDLWQGIELGAISDSVPDKKVALMVGITWFMDYQDPAECFRETFSDEAYLDFIGNPDISVETKEKVNRKMLEYGIDEATVVSPKNRDVLEDIDLSARKFVAPLRAKATLLEDKEDTWNSPARHLNESRPVPEGRRGEPQQPDWDAWMQRERDEAAEATSSNDIGGANSWYKARYEKYMRKAAKWSPEPGREYQETEIEDFKLFLDICKETGTEPLIVLMPVKGELFDQTAYDREVRATWYRTMAEICEEYGVEYVDFSDKEYDPYFLYDALHFGWTGWVENNKALYEFFMEGK